MTKEQFLSKLADELARKKVADAEDILSEDEQHFAFKTADGFIEEDIAAKLGDPAALAAQFEGGHEERPGGGKKAVTMTGLCVADLFAGIFFPLLFAWGIAMTALSLTSAVLAVCLFAGVNIASLIPPMPYGIGVAFGLAISAFAVLVAVLCVYYAAFVRQLMRFYARFHQNTLAFANGTAALPSLAIHPRLSPRTNRRIRSIALVSLAVFAASFVLSMVLSVISSGSLGFWHTWGWFGNAGIN